MKTHLLIDIENAITPFSDYAAYETKTRIVIKSKDDIFTCSVIKKITKVCDETNNRFNVIMENAKVKIEIFKH
ncbi:hypothetical protein SAMN04487765_3743 [Tenacibaculum sp. MAR_2010_89]|uniref:hypothetical protein n=1 Tax=Tenacibaculum sp. MAR_2010_89 TaxID=1250198 RepID=UPI00089649E3|nr:hypothetical protein [Tenacibaculum sp. MAR_2010_89]SEE67519.1 hypothetical protein SAMN04487765_3743 [Tenacibaculum sp. MAR_2010_89]